MKVLLLLCGLVVTLTTCEPCAEQTRPHATRCDQFFRCVLLPSRTHVWVPTQCEKGLIYEPQLKTCVLPGDDWECNLSAEVGNESGENIYGINNLPAAIYAGPTLGPIRSTTAFVTESVPLADEVGHDEPETVTDQQPTNLPIIGGDNEGYYIVLDRDGNNRTTFYHTPPPYQDDEEDFSGDGPPVEVELTTTMSLDGILGKNSQTTMPAASDINELSKTELNSFLADYTLKTSSETPTKTKTKTKTKHPLPPDGKIHPEHMTVILNQQKKLNRIASQLKMKVDPTGGVGEMSPFTHQPVFMSRPEGSVLFNVPQRVAEESTKSPFMSDDVIRSIIEISKQMMTNQKPQSEEMYVKPIFIPISVSSATQDFSRLPEKPSKVMFHQLFPSLSSNTSQFSPKPIGITITNPYTLGQATIYDNFRDQVMNDSQYYSYQTTVVDAYGNRYPPQPMPSPQMYPPQMYPPSMVYPVYSQQNYPYPNSYIEHPMVTNRLRNTLGYDNDDSSSNENTISEEEDDTSAELPEKEVSAPLNLDTNEENEDSNEQPDMKKLISVGGATLNYNDYKDSILPLLDANPDEVRISVLTCTLGSRQPNKTDCTKYYVCNPHNGAFQSFTCPSFTAFNIDTRICDTATYKSCLAAKPNSPTPQPTALSRIAQHKAKHQIKSETSQLKHDLMTAHKYVDLIKKEAIKVLSRSKVTTESPKDGDVRPGISSPTVDSSSPTITTPKVTFSSKRTRSKPKRKPVVKKRPSSKVSSKSAAGKSNVPNTTTTPKPVPKPPKCRRNGKIPDPAVKHNYYVCYKASPKKFIKTRMACPNNLVYCGSTEYCTYEKDCKKL